MDWKRFYADELARPEGRQAIRDAVDRHARGDPRILAALLSGGIASFPHVSLRESASPIARVVQSILESGRRQVVALGVLHGGTLPSPEREAWSLLNAASESAENLYRRFSGAFVARGAAATPFGPVEEASWTASTALIREDAHLLSGEFSLDLFLALLAASAQARGVRPPAVTRVYVSATRSPGGHFDVASALAAEIHALIGADAVCVATGDLAHIGHGYMPPADVEALPADVQALEARVLPELGEMHDAALARRDFAAAWTIGTRLRSDQRHLLPVVAELIGTQGAYELLSFQFSDYAAINGVPPPCWVAAALGVFRRAG